MFTKDSDPHGPKADPGSDYTIPYAGRHRLLKEFNRTYAFLALKVFTPKC